MRMVASGFSGMNWFRFLQYHYPKPKNGSRLINKGGG
jgi:hypothetical protein